MELTNRQRRILRAIVDLYIRTAEPVGSKAIAEMPDVDFSSATIRNEMAVLTEAGLLEQPHTSAGRIPSPAGYRLYVDELMQDYRLSIDETQNLNLALENKMQEVDKVISQVGKLVSQLSGLPAYAVAAPSRQLTATRFEVLQGGEQSFILVIMTSDEQVHNKLIRLPLNCSEQDLKLLSAVLNATMTGLTLPEITPEVLSRTGKSAGGAEPLVSVIVDELQHVLQSEEQKKVFLTGQSRLLGQPEYRNIDKAQEVLSTLDEELVSNLPAPMGDQNLQILVGPENIARELKDTSVVMTRFDIGDGMQGMIGVVGPQRMDYAQVTARLSYFAENLGRMFAKQERNELPSGKNQTEE